MKDDGLKLPDLSHRRVLEVGCGSRARAARGARTYVGIDVHGPYLLDARRRYRAGIFMFARWREALEMFEDQTFTACFAIDFIEHLGRRDGKAFLREAERVAESVAIFTPLGPMPQNSRNGMRPDDPSSQMHKSAWTPEDFGGWQIRELRHFHRQLADGTPLDEPISAFWAIRR